MATCLRYGYAGSFGMGLRNIGNFLMIDEMTPMVTPLVQATFLLPDTSTTDIAQCAVVGVTGAEFVSLRVGNVAAAPVVYPAWDEISNLSLENVVTITPYIFLWWAGAWAVKQIARSITTFSGNS